MDLAWRLLKAQQTLHGFSRRSVKDLTSPSHSNIWISPKSKHIKEELPNEEYSRLSDEMLARLGQLNAKGEFTITSAKGKGEWGPEPSFMLTDVPNHLHDDIHRLADEYEQHSVAVSGAGDKGAQFVKPDGKVTDEFGGMEFQENPEFSTDYPSGQRLAFTDWSDPVQTGEPMDITMRLLKEMYHGTQASPQSLMEYGIQPPAENPTMAMTWERPPKERKGHWTHKRGRPAGRNMAMFEQWHRLQDVSPEEREEKMNALQEMNNRVYVTPIQNYARGFGDPSMKNTSRGKEAAAMAAPGQVVNIDDSNLNLTAGAKGADMEMYNQGAIPPSLIQDIEPVQTGEPMDIAMRLLKMPAFFQEESPWLQQQLYQAGVAPNPPDPETKPPPRDMRSDMGDVKIVGGGNLPTEKPEVFAEGPKRTHHDDWDVSHWFAGPLTHKPPLTMHGERHFQSNNDKVRATFGKPDAHGVVRVPKFAVRDDSRGEGHGRAGWEELVAEIKALHGDHVTVKPTDILRESQGFWDKVGVRGRQMPRDPYPKGERTAIKTPQKI